MDPDPIIAFVASIRDLLPYLAAIFIAIIAVTFLRTTRKVMARQEPGQPATPPIPAPAIESKPGPEVVAVITAAVAATTGHFHRVVSIRRQVNLWEKVGRQSVLKSHRIR